MPRRNLRLLVGLTVFCLICAMRASRYGQVLVYAMRQIQFRALEPVGERELFAGALQGMTARLDRYSAYIPPELLAEFEESLTRQFGGLGIEILLDPETGQLTVASPLPDTPAQRAGIRSGDKILKIDGESTEGMSLEDAQRRMRGEPGDPVTLTVLHPSEEEPVDIRIVRAVIKVSTVLGDTRNEDGTWNYILEGHPGIGYVRVVSFSEETAKELKEVIQRLRKKQGVEALILDLRNNPGGLLETAIEVCDLFIRSGEIVSTRDRHARARRAFYARAEGTLEDFPLVVLVNQLSASASEIVAACLQDHKRAAIVGQRTFGKGTVQEIVRLERPDGVLKLTTASYWRPSGKNIHRTRDAEKNGHWGVTPDPGLEVVVEGDELDKLHRWRLDRDLHRTESDSGADPNDLSADPQLTKAIEYLEEKLGRKQQGATQP